MPLTTATAVSKRKATALSTTPSENNATGAAATPLKSRKVCTGAGTGTPASPSAVPPKIASSVGVRAKIASTAPGETRPSLIACNTNMVPPKLTVLSSTTTMVIGSTPLSP
ncbi:hypothetical protein DYI42_21355 [Vannielia litorea]|nr:hypothetical protein [Vannielia litorea]